MQTMTINKIIAAVLLALLVGKGADILGNIPFHAEAPEEPAFAVASAESEETAEQKAAQEPEGPSLAARLAEASADAGERTFRKCAACHTIEEGGANRVGPNLYNVVGAELGHADGFNYSGALTDFGGEWTYARLDQWLEAPNELIPGNRMGFAGLSDGQERADVIAYLRANTDDPPPLPEAEQAAAEPAEESGAAESGQESAQAEKDDAPSQAQQAGAADGAQSGESSALAGALREASADRGKKLFNRCATCHTIEKGAPHRVGPNLHNVVGADRARRDGFSYSSNFADLEGRWTYQRLSEFIANPMDTVPGTRMAFAGLDSLQDRADVIAYLRDNTEDPPPLPGKGGE